MRPAASGECWPGGMLRIKSYSVYCFSVFRGVMTSIERRVYGPDAFVGEARATRALLKFCADHESTHPAIGDIRACLAALEAGEKSNAVAAYNRVPLGKDGFGDWWPPSMSPQEGDEYAWAVFEALGERWYRLMDRLAGR
jgi:hypothetical protein